MNRMGSEESEPRVTFRFVHRECSFRIYQAKPSHLTIGNDWFTIFRRYIWKAYNIESSIIFLHGYNENQNNFRLYKSTRKFWTVNVDLQQKFLGWSTPTLATSVKNKKLLSNWSKTWFSQFYSRHHSDTWLSFVSGKFSKWSGPRSHMAGNVCLPSLYRKGTVQ